MQYSKNLKEMEMDSSVPGGDLELINNHGGTEDIEIHKVFLHVTLCFPCLRGLLNRN
jgi:hypothetical protein